MNITLNEKIDITVAAGIISSEGRNEINDFMRKLGIPILPVWWDWHTRLGGKGEYVGSFPKRVAKYYYQTIQYKMSSDNLGTIGSIMSTHTNRDNRYIFDFTDCFDWEAGDFGDDGSCYWTCHGGAREALENHRAHAVRFYDEDGEGYGRAWICQEGDYCVIFNGYGLPTADISRIIADYWGVSYRKVSLNNRGHSNGLIWINSGIGFAIGAESTINGLTRVNMEIEGGRECIGCNCSIDEDCYYVDDVGELCADCFDENYFHCQSCDGVSPNEECREVHCQHGMEYICSYCCDKRYTQCDDCEEYHLDSKIMEIDDGHVCRSCSESGGYHTCDNCDDLHSEDNFTSVDGKMICEDCLHYYECSECGDYHTDMDEIHGKSVCSDCFDKVSIREYPLLCV